MIWICHHCKIEYRYRKWCPTCGGRVTPYRRGTLPKEPKVPTVSA